MKMFPSIILLLLLIISCSKSEEPQKIDTELYFPSTTSNTWETVSAESLGWNTTEIDPLLSFLEEKNTKGFIVLYNGRIVLENYFNNHSENSTWYWASAGKTLTSIMTGIAEEQGFLDINKPVSTYLGTSWTSINLDKEILITPKHLLTMTSGLDDSLGDNVAPENLKYAADAGFRWAYHNVYVKLQQIIEVTTSQTFSNYFSEQLKNKIGMTGTWIQLNDLSVYWSNTRSMAKFGLLALNNGVWDSTRIINSNYFNRSIQTSQTINNAYGYLWWLNGKENYHLPQSQYEFQGSLIPNTPTDMYAALGKNDQKIYVVPSKKLVIIRMGESAANSNFAVSTFDYDLWEKINLVIN
ncbi:serine hydrolase domain-containing protein [Lutibacter holmesii]|uniref:Serine hydrolase domain-containing protein n=1 Tax=Lutibacter holmesii TaxID=1137985 RepID=A0ABW3WK25_9FLAO